MVLSTAPGVGDSSATGRALRLNSGEGSEELKEEFLQTGVPAEEDETQDKSICTAPDSRALILEGAGGEAPPPPSSVLTSPSDDDASLQLMTSSGEYNSLM